MKLSYYVGRKGFTNVRFVILCVVVPFTCLVSNVEALSDDTLRQRFIEEAPRKWEEYAERASMVQGVMKLIQHDAASGTKSTTTVSRKANNECRLVVIDYDSLETRDEVYAYNSHYSFFLNRVRDEAGWQLTSGGPRKKEGLNEEGIIAAIDRYATVNREFVSLAPIALVDLVKRPEFKLVSAEWDTVDEKQLAKITFTCQHDMLVEGANANPYQEGVLWLDPNQFWIVRKATGVKEGLKGLKVLANIEITQSTTNLEVPLPALVKSVYVRSIPGQRDLNIPIEVEYDLRIPSELPTDSEFSLTAFGLPELDRLASESIGTPTRWWLWSTLLGVAMLVLVLVAIRFRSTRRA